MNSMPTGRRRQAILVLIGTAAVLAGLWYTLVNAQNRRLAVVAEKIGTAEFEIEKIRKARSVAQEIEASLAAASGHLDVIEADMASGDLYSWVVNAIRQFKTPYKVEIPQFGQPVEKETTLLPKFPYRQVSMNITGTAFYHDLGKFIAEFENRYPYSQIQHLELEPALAASGAEREKLTFHMDIVTLVKPTS